MGQTICAAKQLDIARKKKNSERITWIQGDISEVIEISVDLAVMTGNIAQVFLTDTSWLSTLKGIYNLLKPNGRLVFETRRPHSRAWEKWTKAQSFKQLKLPDIGAIDIWILQ